MNKLYSRYNQIKELKVEDSFSSRFSSGSAVFTSAPAAFRTATEALRSRESTIETMERSLRENIGEAEGEVRESQPQHVDANVNFSCNECHHRIRCVVIPNMTNTVMCPNCSNVYRVGLIVESGADR